MAAAINEVRAEHGLHALRRSSSLMGSAGRFSSWLMEHDHFGHLSSIRASSRFTLLGEALAMHGGRRFRVRATLGRWMASSVHRSIVLSPAMGALGTGVARGRMGRAPATVWVLQVGKLAPDAGSPGTAVPDVPDLPALPVG
jgi:uncharacterized protein YkwD